METRSRLIEVGMQLLDTELAKVKVSDVTETAGTAKGTFYLYFETWEHYLAAIRDHMLEQYVEDLGPRLTGINKANYWKILDREIGNLIQWIANRQNLHRHVFHGTELNQPIPANLSADGFIAATLTQGQELGLVRSNLDTRLMSPLLFKMIHAAGETATSDTVQKLIRQTRLLIKASIAG